MSRVTGSEQDAGEPPEAPAADSVLGSVTGAVSTAVTAAVDTAREAARSTGRRATRRGANDGPAGGPTGEGREARRPDGRSARWAAHRAARREELIEAAIGAIARHGAAVGMDQIAAEAGTSKPVVYRYFTDKDDLYRAVSRRAVGQVLESLATVTGANPPPRELLHAGVDAYLTLLEANPELYRFVSQHPLVGEGDSAIDFSTAAADLLTAQLSAHLAECGLDPAFASPWGDAMVGFINAASIWWLDHRDAMDRPQLTAYLSALLWGGVAGVLQVSGQDVDAAPAPGVFPPLTH